MENNDADFPKIHRWMDVGQIYDSIQNFSFQRIPGFLHGADYLHVRRFEKDLKFQFRKPSYLYVFTRDTISGLERLSDSIVNNKGQAFKIFRKVLASGQEFVLLNELNAELIAFQQQSGLQPAFDLKESTTYKANHSENFEGMRMVDFQNQERLQYISDDGWMEFEIKVGVADVYSLTLKYHNETSEVENAWIEMITLDGVVLMPKQKIHLLPTRSGKWNYIDTDTGSISMLGRIVFGCHRKMQKNIYLDALEVK